MIDAYSNSIEDIEMEENTKIKKHYKRYIISPKFEIIEYTEKYENVKKEKHLI